MIEVERSIMHIELGWHLALLNCEVIPTVRGLDYLGKDVFDALTALRTPEDLSSLALSDPEPSDPDLAKLKPAAFLYHKHHETIVKLREFGNIGIAYCKNPVPLFVKSHSCGMRCVSPIYIHA
jgi:hypothetical protein